MVFPSVTPWMEQFRNNPSLRVNASKVGSFVQVAINAGESQVVRRIVPAMHLGDDVFDVMYR
jgi:hypothetical protein